MATSNTPVNLESKDGIFRIKHHAKNQADLYQNDIHIASLGIYGLSAYWYAFYGKPLPSGGIKLIAEFIQEVSLYTKEELGSFRLAAEGNTAKVYRKDDQVATVTEKGDIIPFIKTSTKKKWGLQAVTYTNKKSLHEFAIKLIANFVT
jgi:hypothetical protein